jgi:hypothetical protein
MSVKSRADDILKEVANSDGLAYRSEVTARFLSNLGFVQKKGELGLA